MRAAATASAGLVSQPTFQPVAEKVLPADEIVIVRSSHPPQGRHRNVLGVVEDEVLVDLVRDHPGIVLAGQRCHQLQLSPGEDLPVGLCGC